MNTEPTRARRLAAVVPALALVLLCAAWPLAARELSSQEAAAIAQREGGGKVLAVQTLRVGKRKVYRVKLLSADGTMREVQVPAEQ